MTDQIELPPPPPIPPFRKSRMYVAIWRPGYPPMKADLNAAGFPKWKPITVDEYLAFVEKFRAQQIIAEQASVDREFGHMAMGL